jgi:hypothetical protein
MKIRREVFGYGMKQLTSNYELCLWPGDKCKNRPIRAHSVQNQRVLDLLCETGKVVMPKLEVGFEQPPNIVFRKIGRKNATTFTGLCGKHDHAMFKPIETSPIDINKAEHLFLLAYRAVLKETHSVRKAAVDLQLSYLKGTERGLFPKDELSTPGMLAVEQMMAAYLVESEKVEMDAAYLTRTWDRVSHEVAEIAGRPTIAVNSMFTTGIYSEITDAPAFVMLNVFPRNETTVVVFSYLKEHRLQAHQAFGHIWAASGHYNYYLLSKLILMKCENLVMSPSFYESLPEQQIEVIAYFFMRNSCGHTFDYDDPRLFLFEPVSMTD